MAKLVKDKKKLSVKVKKGGFHEWLGKAEDSPITDYDINKGLASKDPKVRKMAIFAKNAKKWKHEKKKSVAKEELVVEAAVPNWAKW